MRCADWRRLGGEALVWVGWGGAHRAHYSGCADPIQERRCAVPRRRRLKGRDGLVGCGSWRANWACKRLVKRPRSTLQASPLPDIGLVVSAAAGAFSGVVLRLAGSGRVRCSAGAARGTGASGQENEQHRYRKPEGTNEILGHEGTPLRFNGQGNPAAGPAMSTHLPARALSEQGPSCSWRPSSTQPARRLDRAWVWRPPPPSIRQWSPGN